MDGFHAAARSLKTQVVGAPSLLSTLMRLRARPGSQLSYAGGSSSAKVRLPIALPALLELVLESRAETSPSGRTTSSLAARRTAARGRTALLRGCVCGSPRGSWSLPHCHDEPWCSLWLLHHQACEGPKWPWLWVDQSWSPQECPLPPPCLPWLLPTGAHPGVAWFLPTGVLPWRAGGGACVEWLDQGRPCHQACSPLWPHSWLLPSGVPPGWAWSEGPATPSVSEVLPPQSGEPHWLRAHSASLIAVASDGAKVEMEEGLA